MSYYDGDAWSNHVLNEVKCAECEEYFDDQEGEGNICPPCVEKEGERMICKECEGDGCTKCTVFCGDCLTPIENCGCQL